MTLEGVTFGDGATASGYFVINLYGYIESADITTTAGSAVDSVSMTGYSYGASGFGVANGPPFDVIFTFNSSVNDFVLQLDVQTALYDGYSGFDPLVVGVYNKTTPSGSFEVCTQNPTNCGGPGYLDGRLVTAGTLYAPEPATFSLFGVGGLALSLLRRRRAAVR